MYAKIIIFEKKLPNESLHHSITPSLHHSITPSLHHSNNLIFKIFIFLIIWPFAVFSQFVPNGGSGLHNSPTSTKVGIGSTLPTYKLEVKDQIYNYFYEENEAEEILGTPLFGLYGDHTNSGGLGFISNNQQNLMEAFIKPQLNGSFIKTFEISGLGNVTIGSSNVTNAELKVFGLINGLSNAKIGTGPTIGSRLMVYAYTNEMSYYSKAGSIWIGLYNNAGSNGFGNPITKSGDHVWLFNGSGLTFGSGMSGALKGFRIDITGDLEAGRDLEVSRDLIVGNDEDITRDLNIGRNLNVTDHATITNYLAIGTTDPKGYNLAVNGSIIAELVKVKLNGNWPDYVFNEEYNLMPLEEVNNFISSNHHLPGVPSEQEIQANDIDLGKMDAILLQKIEELTLYIIQLEQNLVQLQNAQK